MGNVFAEKCENNNLLYNNILYSYLCGLRFFMIMFALCYFFSFVFLGQAEALSSPLVTNVSFEVEHQVSPQMFGAVGDGKTDDTNAFLKMALFCNLNPGTCVRIPAGHYIILEPLTFTEDVTIHGDGQNSLLDYSGIQNSRSAAILITGTYRELEALESLQYAGGNSIQYHMSEELSKGDIIALLDPKDYSWSKERSYYRKGEFCEIRSSGRTSAELVCALHDNYEAGCRLLLMDMVRCELTGVRVRVFDSGNETGMTPIMVCNARNSLIRDVIAEGSNNAQIEISSCYDVLLDHIRVEYVSAENLGNNYGVMVGNSQYVRVINSSLGALRHGMAIGGRANGAFIVNRYIAICDSTISSKITTGANIHGNSQYISYNRCEIFNGLDFAGSDISISNCNFYTNTRMLWMTSYNLVNVNLYLKGNHFYATNQEENNSSDYLLSVILPEMGNEHCDGMICIEDNVFEKCGEYAVRIKSHNEANQYVVQMKNNLFKGAGNISIENIYMTIIEGNMMDASCSIMGSEKIMENSVRTIDIINNIFYNTTECIEINVEHASEATINLSRNTIHGNTDESIKIESADSATVIMQDNLFLPY